MYNGDFEQTVYQQPTRNQDNLAAYLYVFDGREIPRRIDMNAFGKSEITFGRSSENDIVLESMLVSRAHGKFLLHEGYCTVVDIDVRNLAVQSAN